MTTSARILIVDDEEEVRDLLAKVLERNGYQVTVMSNGGSALAFLEDEPVDLVLTDVRMPGIDGMEALRSIKELRPETVVIILTGFGSIDQAVQAVKDGAYDYINKPFKIDEMLLTIQKALDDRRLHHEVTTLRQEVRTRYHFASLIGKSRAMQEVFALIEQVAGSRSTVMIYGESGTGKELVAKAVHSNSPRADKPFVEIDCAGFAEAQLASELFGYERGVVAGTSKPLTGKLEFAAGGTLFVNKIERMPLDTQTHFAQVIEKKTFRRIAGLRDIPIDVRIIAATNRDLKRAVVEGAFREDLYYRLNVIPITLPDLKDRQEDIPLLANHFVRLFTKESGSEIREISKEAMVILLAYSWPGNVRELESTMERAVTLGRGPTILPADLPPHLVSGTNPLEKIMAREASLEDLERDYIAMILRRTRGHQIRTATILGIDRRTLYRKIRQYGIKLNDL